MLAAACGLVDICKGLVETHKVTTNGNKEGYNALHYACFKGDISITQYLLTHSIFLDQINASVLTGEGAGFKPIHHAVLSGNLGLVKLLHARGADINAENQEKLTPLFIATYADHVDIFQYLKEQGSYIDQKSEIGRTILDSAIINGARQILHYVIDELGFDINSKSDGHFSNYPLLTAAVFSSDITLLEFLINEKHADPFIARSSSGRTILHELVMIICNEMEKNTLDHTDAAYIDTLALLKAKILILSKIESHDGRKLIEESDEQCHTTPLLSAVGDFGSLEITKFLLQECQADVNAISTATGVIHGLNAIGIAIHYGKLPIVKFLLQQDGIKLDTRDYHGNNLLHLAAAKGDLDVIRDIFYNHQTEFILMSNQINHFGQNFLHLTASCNIIPSLARAQLIAEITGSLENINKTLCNQLLHKQRDLAFGRSSKEEIDQNTAVAFFLINLRKAQHKLAEEKHRLGIDKIEENIVQLQTDVAELKTEFRGFRAEVRDQFNQMMGILTNLQPKQPLELAGVTTLDTNNPDS